MEMEKFIAAMDHSGGSTGGVLERYEQEFNEDNKMEKVHAMRLRMVNSPSFTSDNIWAAILYKDTVERGMVPILKEKGIESYLKIDGGCDEDGTLKQFPVKQMLQYALENKCTGTKMRSIVYGTGMIHPVLKQQFKLAETIYASNLMPIVEPEVPIDNPIKGEVEDALMFHLQEFLDEFSGKCILKLTIPNKSNLYKELTRNSKVHKVVGLSGGYTTADACLGLALQENMTASFSRALSEGLFVHQDEATFNARIKYNVDRIVQASTVSRKD
jgi:fructose-bisphosphate aldolase class I|tara:strand:+ start:2992 stop:3807 length:816 start_codon:yes stop_codon:yes gene_type:complete